MNSRSGLVVLTLVLLAFFSSCKKKTIPEVSAAPTETINKITVSNVDFNYFSAKGRMQVDSKKMNISSALTIRMKKDSIIWISLVPALGIEAVRAKITPDSFYVIDRINRNYYAGDYAYVNDHFNINTSFEMLQAILLGNYLPGNPQQQKVMAFTPMQHVRQTDRNMIIDHYVDTNRFKLKKVEIQDTDSQNKLSVDYEDFQPIADMLFPYSSLVVVQPEGNESNNTSLSIKYSRISTENAALEFPFSVPQGYDRR